LSKTTKFPSISDKCHRIDVIDSLVRKTVSNNDFNDPLKQCLLNDCTTKDGNLEVAMCA